MARVKQSLARKIARAFFFVPFLLLLSPVLLVMLLARWTYRVAIYALIWSLWVRNGKDVLFVSSNSPIWQEYMATQVLTLVRERAFILNWSERKSWAKHSLQVRAFHMFAGGRDFNPAVMVFRPFRGAKLFRFLPAFQERKHGRPQRVDQLRRDLINELSK
jgi:hypothetical protein